MQRGETAEAFKVRNIQCQYMVYSMHDHGRRQSRIVHLNTQNLSGNNVMPASIACTSRSASAAVKPKPLRGSGRVLAFQARLHSGACNKELCLDRRVERALNLRVGVVVGPPRHAQEDVGIDQARRNGHLIAILIKPLARYVLGQGRNLSRELGK
jgi:hypothetical protein